MNQGLLMEIVLARAVEIVFLGGAASWKGTAARLAHLPSPCGGGSGVRLEHIGYQLDKSGLVI